MTVKQASGTSVAVDAVLCVAVLGRELTAYVADLASTDELDAWATVGWPDTGLIRTRLRAAAKVVSVFATVNLVTLAAAWLREVGAVAGRAAPPAKLIRDATDE